MINRLVPTRIEPYFCAKKILGDISRVKKDDKPNLQKELVNTMHTDTFTFASNVSDNKHTNQIQKSNRNKSNVFDIFTKK